MSRVPIVCILTVLALTFGPAAHAQSEAPNAGPPDMAAMAARLDALEQKNAALTAQVAQLLQRMDQAKATLDQAKTTIDRAFADTNSRLRALERNDRVDGPAGRGPPGF